MSKKTLRQVSRERPSLEELQQLLTDAAKGSDRMSALLSTIYLQDVLTDFMVAHLARREDQDAIAKLYDREGALSTFFSQTHLAYAMGLIDEMVRDDLDVLRRIRNAFAHSPKNLGFDTPEVARECKKLKVPFTIERLKKRTLTPRDLFRVASSRIIVSIIQRHNQRLSRQHRRLKGRVAKMHQQGNLLSTLLTKS